MSAGAIARRGFIVGVGAGLVTTLVAPTQPADKVRRIGLLSGFTPGATPSQLRQELAELGWVEGQNLAIDARFAHGNLEKLPALAAELVGRNVEVIVAVLNQEIRAAMQATSTIPIVMVLGIDPVGARFVSSLGRPGGNVTGTTVQPPEVAGKGIALLREVAPQASRVAILIDPGVPGFAAPIAEGERATRALRLTPRFIEVRRPADVEPALARIKAWPAEALYVVPTSAFGGTLPRIVDFAQQSRLPAIYTTRAAVDLGGLMSYGYDQHDLYRRNAACIDKILRGARPADLPVEAPVRYELLVNLKTARAMGHVIPPSLLLRADQVIE
jgi:putative ABC transport system substrate-binding protein